MMPRRRLLKAVYRVELYLLMMYYVSAVCGFNRIFVYSKCRVDADVRALLLFYIFLFRPHRLHS